MISFRQLLEKKVKWSHSEYRQFSKAFLVKGKLELRVHWPRLGDAFAWDVLKYDEKTFSLQPVKSGSEETREAAMKAAEAAV